MKTLLRRSVRAGLAAIVLTASAQAADPLVYRGVLSDAGAPAQGRYDLQLRIHGGKGDPLALVGPLLIADVQVTDGAFAVALPVATSYLPTSGWIEAAVRDAGTVDPFETLPEQQTFALNAKAVCPGSWEIIGNPGIAAGNFIGTTDNAPFEIRANNRRGLRISDGGAGINVLGGHPSNEIGAGVAGATVFGGAFFTDPGVPNRALASGATISGGWNNTAGAAGVSAQLQTIAGGSENVATGPWAAVGGGTQNLARGDSAVVPGGYLNEANGELSFAAGSQAKVATEHRGTFVWSDVSGGDFASSGSNQFLVRAVGGVGLGTNAPFEQLTVGGDVALTREADREFYVGQEPDNNANGKALVMRAGNASNTGVPNFARRGGDLILQAGQGYNVNQVGQDGGDVILRSGGNHISGTDNGGDIVFQTGGASGTFTERARIAEGGQLSLSVLGSAGATTLCRNASNQIASCSSSARYKHAIVDSSLGLDTVAALRTVDYVWNADGSADVGLVAEEVATVAPQLVTRNADGEVEGVKYDRLAAVLVHALQQQQAQIAELQQQLQQQSAQQEAVLQLLIARLQPEQADSLRTALAAGGQ